MPEMDRSSSAVREAVIVRLKKKYPDLESRHGQLAERFTAYFGDFWEPYSSVYGSDDRLEKRAWRLFRVIARAIGQRDAHLLRLDEERDRSPGWFQDRNLIGMMMYADRFSGSLKKLDRRIGYLKELGISYVHLMPLAKTREGQDDGGYAVSDYRKVKPGLGNVDQLRALAQNLHREGISLALDLVMNHTAREHKWARRAAAGKDRFQKYYFMFDDRAAPDAYEHSLPEVFPDSAPGSFTWVPEAEKWVWTTFHDFQWDLDFSNPDVFEAMWREMVFLANLGADVIRLDAVPFIWKRVGTDCRNQPEAVMLIAAYRALMRIFAPAVAFKAEAIVSPEQIVRYLGVGGLEGRACDIAYNATLMNHMWHALACENVHLLRTTLSSLPEIPEETTWVNYVRCHDDIGWGISDENAAAVGQNGHETRRFCSDFYAGDYEGSYAEGYRFQRDSSSGETRTSGTAAALCGLQKAIIERNAAETDVAIRRLLLLHSITFFMRGFPVLYSGDEIGQFNDYSYLDDPLKASDNRWIHRPPMDWARADVRSDPTSAEGRLFEGIRRLASTRRQLTTLNGRAEQTIVPLKTDSVFCVRRRSGSNEILMLANFSRSLQRIGFAELPATWLSGRYRNHLTDATLDFSHGDHIVLEPYECLWLGHPENGTDNTTVPVDIRLHVETRPGEMVYLSGNIPQLGEWNPDRALGPLDPSEYPVWKGSIRARPGVVFECVWIKKRDRTVVERENEVRVCRVNGIAPHREADTPKTQ